MFIINLIAATIIYLTVMMPDSLCLQSTAQRSDLSVLYCHSLAMNVNCQSTTIPLIVMLTHSVTQTLRFLSAVHTPTPIDNLIHKAKTSLQQRQFALYVANENARGSCCGSVIKAMDSHTSEPGLVPTTVHRQQNCFKLQ